MPNPISRSEESGLPILGESTPIRLVEPLPMERGRGSILVIYDKQVANPLTIAQNQGSLG